MLGGPDKDFLPIFVHPSKPLLIMELSPADKEMLGRQSTGRSVDVHMDDPERLATRRRAFHSKVLIGGLIITVVLGLALGLGLGLTVGRYGRG